MKGKKKAKTRNWQAVNAHFRKAGPMKKKDRHRDEDWEEWVEQIKAYMSVEDYLKEGDE